MDRCNPEQRTLLYQIEGFYVEVFLYPKHNSIKRMRSFKSTEQLRPYLDTMPVAVFKDDRK
jgi:hypothetical protein